MTFKLMRYIDLHNDIFDGFYEIQLHEFFFLTVFFNCVSVNLTLITRETKHSFSYVLAF